VDRNERNGREQTTDRIGELILKKRKRKKRKLNRREDMHVGYVDVF
jgi:hypothetical protein